MKKNSKILLITATVFLVAVIVTAGFFLTQKNLNRDIKTDNTDVTIAPSILPSPQTILPSDELPLSLFSRTFSDISGDMDIHFFMPMSYSTDLIIYSINSMGIKIEKYKDLVFVGFGYNYSSRRISVFDKNLNLKYIFNPTKDNCAQFEIIGDDFYTVCDSNEKSDISISEGKKYDKGFEVRKYNLQTGILSAKWSYSNGLQYSANAEITRYKDIIFITSFNAIYSITNGSDLHVFSQPGEGSIDLFTDDKIGAFGLVGANDSRLGGVIKYDDSKNIWEYYEKASLPETGKYRVDPDNAFFQNDTFKFMYTGASDKYILVRFDQASNTWLIEKEYKSTDEAKADRKRIYSELLKKMGVDIGNEEIVINGKNVFKLASDGTEVKVVSYDGRFYLHDVEESKTTLYRVSKGSNEIVKISETMLSGQFNEILPYYDASKSTMYSFVYYKCYVDECTNKDWTKLVIWKLDASNVTTKNLPTNTTIGDEITVIDGYLNIYELGVLKQEIKI